MTHAMNHKHEVKSAMVQNAEISLYFLNHETGEVTCPWGTVYRTRCQKDSMMGIKTYSLYTVPEKEDILTCYVSLTH